MDGREHGQVHGPRQCNLGHQEVRRGEVRIALEHFFAAAPSLVMIAEHGFGGPGPVAVFGVRGVERDGTLEMRERLGIPRETAGGEPGVEETFWFTRVGFQSALEEPQRFLVGSALVREHAFHEPIGRRAQAKSALDQRDEHVLERPLPVRRRCHRSHVSESPAASNDRSRSGTRAPRATRGPRGRAARRAGARPAGRRS